MSASNAFRRFAIVVITTLGCAEALAQYSVGSTACYDLSQDGWIQQGVAISSPIGVVCESGYYGTLDRPGISTPVKRDNLFVHLGNTTVSLRADLVSLKTELDALRLDYLRVKAENEQWRINTLSAALDRIEKMPGEFASLKSVQDVLTPLIIEAIKNDPTLLAKLKAP